MMMGVGWGGVGAEYSVVLVAMAVMFHCPRISVLFDSEWAMSVLGTVESFELNRVVL